MVEEVKEQENLEVAFAEQQAAANSGDGQDNSSSAADENAVKMKGRRVNCLLTRAKRARKRMNPSGIVSMK